MSVTDKKVQVPDIEVTRIWYRDGMGRIFSVIKYPDPYGVDGQKNSEQVPIYVVADGRQPRTLGEIMMELQRYQEQEANLKKSTNEKVYSLEYDVSVLSQRLEALEKRKWWKR